jgi:hypothetical protein
MDDPAETVLVAEIQFRKTGQSSVLATNSASSARGAFDKIFNAM